MKDNEKTSKPCRFSSHTISVAERKKATLSGVSEVESAESAEVIAVTCLGRLILTGSELKLDRFDNSSGELIVTGNIDGIKYAAAKQPLIKRIFK